MVLPLIMGAGLGAGALIERYGVPLLSIDAIRGSMIPKNDNLEAQALSAMREKLIASEGYRLDVYKDTLGILTVGIGHRVTASDNLKLGQRITPERADALYNADVRGALKSAISQARELNRYNLDMIVALCEVNFQLGSFWRVKFPNTWSLLKSGKKAAAIASLKKSLWFKQTPVRVSSFINAIDRNFA